MTLKHSFIIVGSFMLITSFSIVGQVKADWIIDSSGTLVEVDGSILGEEDNSLEIKQEEVEVKESEDSQQEDSNDPQSDSEGLREALHKREERRREQVKDKAEKLRELAKEQYHRAVKARERSQEDLKQKIVSKLKMKDGSVMEVSQEVEDKDGKVIRRKEFKFEHGDKIKIERPDGDFFELGADDKGRFEIAKDKFKAKTDLPITIDQDNQLVVTKPDGTTKTVTVLPDVAADKLRSLGFTVTDQALDLELEDLGDQMVYRFPVQQEKRFLGIFKRAYQKESIVSAETGEVINTTNLETSPFTRFLELLSF